MHIDVQALTDFDLEEDGRSVTLGIVDAMAYAHAQGVPEPYVGLLTGAWTEHATVGEESAAGIRTVAVTTVGLGNRVAAGRAPVSPWMHGTINTIVVVDAARISPPPFPEKRPAPGRAPCQR